jgi:hypothetical protein
MKILIATLVLLINAHSIRAADIGRITAASDPLNDELVGKGLSGTQLDAAFMGSHSVSQSSVDSSRLAIKRKGKSVELSFTTTSNRFYVLQSATNLSQWNDAAPEVTGGVGVTNIQSAAGARLFWRVKERRPGATSIVVALSTNAANPLLAAVASDDLMLFVTVRTTPYFDSHFVTSTEDVFLSLNDSALRIHYNTEGHPEYIALADGRVLGLVLTNGAVSDVVLLRGASALSAGRVHSTGIVPAGATHVNLDLLRPGQFYDRDAIAGLDGILGKAVGGIDEFLFNDAFPAINKLIEEVIEIGSRNPLLGAVNTLIEAKNKLAKTANEWIDRVEFARDAVRDLQELGNVALEKIGQARQWLGGQLPVLRQNSTRLSRNLNRGRFSAEAHWARPPEWPDDDWAEVSAIVAAMIPPNENVKISFHASGFVANYNRVPTEDFAAVKAEFQRLFGAPPWTLVGPFLEP